MAKSKYHTNKNQKRKNHRTPVKKQRVPPLYEMPGINQKHLREVAERMNSRQK